MGSENYIEAWIRAFRYDIGQHRKKDICNLISCMALFYNPLFRPVPKGTENQRIDMPTQMKSLTGLSKRLYGLNDLCGSESHRKSLPTIAYVVDIRLFYVKFRLFSEGKRKSNISTWKGACF